MGSSYALTRSSSSLRTLPLTQLNTKLRRHVLQRRPLLLAARLPPVPLAACPRNRPRPCPALSQLRVTSRPPLPLDFASGLNLSTTRWATRRWLLKVWRTDWPSWTRTLRPSPTFAHVLSVPPWCPPAPLPSPPLLPPLIPDSDAPHIPTDELDEAAEEELAEFSRKRQARFDERKALRDNHRATCERVQREHEAAFWAEQDRLQEYWENENVAHLDDLAAYDEERARVVSSLEELAESWDRDVVRARRHVVRQNEIEAVTRHIFRLRDEVAYAHEMLVALQGNQTLGEEIDVFLEAAHLGEVPPGFSYRPVDSNTRYVNHPVSPSVPSQPPPASSSSSSLSKSREQGKGKGKAVDSPEKGKGTESSKLPRVTLRLPPPPADFAAVRGSGSKKRVAVEDGASERPLKVKKSTAYDFSGKHTCNLRAAIIDFPLLATSHEPTLPAGFATWTAFFQRYLRAARLLLHYGTRKAIKFPKPCVPCSNTGCPCFTDPEKNSNPSAHIDAFLAYQHAYALTSTPSVATSTPPSPRHSISTSGTRPTSTTEDAAKGGAVDSVGSGDARSEAEDEDEKEEEEEEEEDAMEVDDAAPPIATLSGSSESPTRARSSLTASSSRQSWLAFSRRAYGLEVRAAFLPFEEVPHARRVHLHRRHPSRAVHLDSVPATRHLPERHLRAAGRLLLSVRVRPTSCFEQASSMEHPKEEYPLARFRAADTMLGAAGSFTWAAEMDRIGDLTGRDANSWAALVRDSSPASPTSPSEYLSLPIVYGNVPYPCPVPELTNDAEWRSMALYKARSFTQTLEHARAAMDADTEGRILRGEGREVLSSLPSNWDTANLWGFLAKQEAQVKRELVEARLDEDPSSLFLPGGSPRETPFDADLEDRATPVPGNAPDVPSSLPHASRESTPHARLAGRASIDSERLREALRAAAPRHDNPWAQLALRRVLFGNPGPVLGGGLPLSYVPPTPPPLSTPPPSVRPTQDEIPYESDGRATSLAAELRSSSLMDDSDRSPRQPPLSVKTEDGERSVTPYLDGGVWEEDEGSLETMDISGAGETAD
ncbi:hypothetical protein C8F04DRAFT_1274571 [Mycena alexandri]|uniref:Uncharacterized protein n=1 Tax=Mycena alexandri TaxID=1745969 RepID=A0AAD6S5A0_9AGAR|nr:hypothetical protein C8F04DRAFT_1274571 [Mycena alexandri]